MVSVFKMGEGKCSHSLSVSNMGVETDVGPRMAAAAAAAANVALILPASSHLPSPFTATLTLAPLLSEALSFGMWTSNFSSASRSRPIIILKRCMTSWSLIVLSFA